METSDMLQNIKTAIESNDIALARELLREALLTPTADIYYQASRVAVDITQKRRFLEKALEIDPFHEESVFELGRITQTNDSHTKTESIVEPPKTTKPQSANKTKKPLLLFAGLFGLVVVCAIVLGGLSLFISHGQTTTTNTYKYPTDTPYPTFTPTPSIQTYNIQLERDATTTIHLYPGDEVTVKASGKIVTGMMGWVATPDGVDSEAEFWLSSYSQDTNFRHGSLLYSIDTANQWEFCGSSCQFTIVNGSGGYLQFGINDAKQGDNSGSFELEVTVVSH